MVSRWATGNPPLLGARSHRLKTRPTNGAPAVARVCNPCSRRPATESTRPRLPGFEMLVREAEEDLPVGLGHRVLARPDPVAQRAVDQLTRRRHLVRGAALRPQKPVHG